jgi:hypothetical protein
MTSITKSIPATPAEHVLDETLMAGDVDEAHGGCGVDCQVSKTKIDRDASLFFFFQTIGIDTRDRLDQCGFAMVNVSGSAYDNVRHNN